MNTDDTRSPESLLSDAMDAMRRAYNAMIRELAADIVCEARDNADSWDEDDLQTHIHETIDSHGWVIYTAKAQAVCMVSKNDGVGMDEGLVDASSFKDGIPWSQLAYCAIEADLREEFDSLNFDPSDPASWKAEIEE